MSAPLLKLEKVSKSYRAAEGSAPVSVLRDGQHINTIPTQGATKRQLAEMMVGREVELVQAPMDGPSQVVLHVDGDDRGTRR